MSDESDAGAEARGLIDAGLGAAGWVVQDHQAMNLAAEPGVAVREVPMAAGHGAADCLLIVQRKAVGPFEAKLFRYPPGGVEMRVD